MRHPDDLFDRWYLRVLAAFFVVLCGISSVRYAWLTTFGGGSIAVFTQLLCFLFTAAATVYFIWPRIGHHAMLGLTGLLFFASAPAGPPEAGMFWMIVGMLLVLPYIGRAIFRPRYC